MPFLVFQLRAPLAAWGQPAVGEYRGSDPYPGSSSIFGLLAAALGLRRSQETEQLALARGYALAVGVLSNGSLLRDYHTAQAPKQAAIKKRPHFTRRDELAPSRSELSTILSTRDYRQNGNWLVALQPMAEAPYTLDDLAASLTRPRYVLYLGRKACPPASPLMPRVMESGSALAVMQQYLAQHNELVMKHPQRWGGPGVELLTELTQFIWEHGVDAGVAEADITVTRKDRVLSRGRRQFGDREEYIHLIREGA